MVIISTKILLPFFSFWGEFMRPKLSRGYKNVKRYKEIAKVLVKYGFGFFVKKLYENNLVPSYILNRRKTNLDLSTGKRIRLMCEELGPTFIKLGQIASTRSDLLSDEIIEELMKLQDNVKEVPFEELDEVFKNEFKVSTEIAFSEFDEAPLAAASIGQVHRAILKTGERVIVKIQRPNIKRRVKTDISILLSMSKNFDEYFKDMFPVNLYEIMLELTNSIKYELDYTKEARNTERFIENYKNNNKVYIPKVYWEYTSEKVLTQEWIEGIKVSNIRLIKEKGWDTSKIANIGARLFLKQVFIDGFFHGDPHPGNILVISENKIAFIDFGLCGYFDEKTVSLITNLFIAGAKKDIDKIIDLLMQIESITNKTNINRLKEDLVYLISHYYNMPLKKINISKMVSELMIIIYENKIKLPSQFTLLFKALITLEGTGRLLNPEFSISSILTEFSKEVLRHKYNLNSIFKNLANLFEELLYDLKSYPRQLKNIIKMLEKNKIKISLDLIGFDRLEEIFKNSFNRLSLSLIISSLIIGSSLTVDLDIEPKIFNIPFFSFIGYITAFILCCILVFSIFKDKEKK